MNDRWSGVTLLLIKPPFSFVVKDILFYYLALYGKGFVEAVICSIK
jgi:hypothetical protein